MAITFSELRESFVDTKEAAKLLRVTPGTLNTWRCSGRGPAYTKMGRHVLYSKDALLEFIRQRTITPPNNLPVC